MVIKLVAFDLDDCLFDSTGLSDRARRKGIEAMIERGLEIDEQKALRILDQIVLEYGSNFERHYDFFLRRLEEVYPRARKKNLNTYKLIASAIIAYHHEKVNFIKPYDDVVPCLEKLESLNIKRAIISDGIPVKQYEKILRLNLEEYFDKIIISDEIAIRKPNPMLFKYFLENADVKGKEALYVGDRLDKDILPASKNDIITTYIHRGGKYDIQERNSSERNIVKPDFEIYNLMELFEIIRKI